MKKITLKELHEINNKYPHKKNINQVYYWDTQLAEWKLKGYSCNICGKLFKRPGFIDNHESACRTGIGLADKSPPDAKVITTKGTPWSPIDINQNHKKVA